MRGFTLLETMVALVILAIALLGLAQLFGLATYQNGLARYGTMAITVAQGKLEELKGSYNQELETGNPSADLSAGSHGPDTVTLTAPSQSMQANWQFQVSWTVTDSSGNQKTIVLTVSPQFQNPLQTKTITITSHFSP